MARLNPPRLFCSRFEHLIVLGFATLLASACGGGGTKGGSSGTDGNGDGNGNGDGGADDTDGEPVYPGDLVECCWVVTYGATLPCNAATCYSFAEEACLSPGLGTPCVDRESADVDHSGVVELDELQTACGQVCLDQGYDGTQSVASSGLVPVDGMWDDPGGSVWNCSAIGTINSSVVEEQFCTPPMFASVPPLRPPTHLATVAPAASDGAVQLTVLGTSFGPVLGGAANVGLHDCDGAGLDGGLCTVQVEGLSLTLAESLRAGDYVVPSGQALLAGSAAAQVRFANCQDGVCVGHFRFSKDDGNPLGVGLAWVEHHEPSRSTSYPFVAVSNASVGMGGISAVDGIVTMSANGQAGTLVLQGSGRDSVGDGAFASALFRVEMSLAPVD